ACPGGGGDVGRHGAGRGKIDRYGVAGEKPSDVAGVGRRENDADLVACGAGALLQHPSHRTMAEQCDLHASAFRTASAWTRRTYASTPPASSASEIRSCALCASRIDPGPSSRGVPQFVRCGMSVVKRTTHVSNPGTVASRRGGTAVR